MCDERQNEDRVDENEFVHEEQTQKRRCRES